MCTITTSIVCFIIILRWYMFVQQKTIRKTTKHQKNIYSSKRWYTKNKHDNIPFLSLKVLLIMYIYRFIVLTVNLPPVFHHKSRLRVPYTIPMMVSMGTIEFDTQNLQSTLHLEGSVVDIPRCFWDVLQVFCKPFMHCHQVHPGTWRELDNR